MAIKRERLGTAPASPPLWRDPRVRAIFYQILTLVGVMAFAAYIIHNTMDNLSRQGIASGFGFLRQPAGFGIPQTLIDVQRAVVQRARLLGRSAQHRARGCHRHRSRDHSRLRDRLGAALVQLADRPPGHSVHRGHPQHPRAAADPVLVLRRPAGAASAARQHRPSGRPVLSEQPGLLHAQADLRGRLRLGGPGLSGSARRGVRPRALGQAAPRRHRPAVSHGLLSASACWSACRS